MTMDGWVGLTMICVSQAPCPYLGRQSILYACVLLYSVHTTANEPLDDQNHFPSPREESHPVRQPRQPTPRQGQINEKEYSYTCHTMTMRASRCQPTSQGLFSSCQHHRPKTKQTQQKEPPKRTAQTTRLPNLRQQQPPQQYPTCFSTAATYPSTAVTAPSTVAIVL